jgi:N-acetylglucosaminyldiphosphoundecaprenol N-acetyl-beta-D-mannosaminyltransferase
LGAGKNAHDTITMLFRKLRLFEIPFTLGKLSVFVDSLIAEALAARQKQPKLLMVVSMQDIIAKRQLPAVAAAFKKFDLFTPDGMPLVWLARLLGFQTDRLYGPDIFEAVLEQSEAKPLRHFFYGADQKTLDDLVQNCLTRWPKLKIAGAISPPFRSLSKTETQSMIKKINAAQPSIVWIGLGSWKQLLFAAEIKSSLKAQYIIPVGMAFDVVAGHKKQAPVWMQKIGLEWLFRLWREPARLWQRYVFSVPLLAWWWLQELWQQKFDATKTERLQT